MTKDRKIHTHTNQNNNNKKINSSKRIMAHNQQNEMSQRTRTTNISKKKTQKQHINHTLL